MIESTTTLPISDVEVRVLRSDRSYYRRNGFLREINGRVYVLADGSTGRAWHPVAA